ncbi:hypothetical protein ACIQU5_27960 [Streptomyces sp. NPDC090306]|uniref:hypothetical protein n=1 Tax=Streptomyces sp. NPDC090306 TaxID=3365961 RepID=UPI00382EAA71
MTTTNPDPARTASAAVELIRRFNHETITTGPGWEYPGSAYHAIGALSYLARILPQAIEQCAAPVRRTHADGRLQLDTRTDPGTALTNLDSLLASAAKTAALLGDYLDQAHAASSPMGMDTTGLPEFFEADGNGD